jgi:peptidoglycan/LPS O-acetylase OafA/YrhL
MEFRGAHLRYVDGLRAIAVLAVILYHALCVAAWAPPLVGTAPQMDPVWWFAKLASKGAHGVDLFFVISGLCLSYPALARIRAGRESRFDCRDFVAKRMVRILPPYYIATGIVIAAVLLTTHFGSPVPRAVGTDFSPFSIFKQLLFFDRAALFVNDSFWTLSVEFRWYLVFPILLLLYVRSPRAFLALLAACVVAYNCTRLRAIDIGTLPAFMLGIVAADLQIVGPRFARFALPATVVAFWWALLLEPFSSVPSSFGLADVAGNYTQTNVGWQLAAFAFVVASGRTAWLRRLLEIPMLCGIGVACYGIYLVHQPIIGAWAELAGAHFDPALGFAASVVFALAGGLLFSYLADRPFAGGPARRVLVRALSKPLASAFAFLGIAGRIDLTSSPGPKPVEFLPSGDALRPGLAMELRGSHPGSA